MPEKNKHNKEIAQVPEALGIIETDGKWPEDVDEVEKLLNEINLLKLEGALFCFDPKEAGRRGGTVTFERVKEQPVTIEIHPTYGQPSVLAYKVTQAIFKKVTDEGWPIPDSVSFSQRELANLVGRASFGGQDSRQLYRAVMQLRSAIIHCAWHDKDTKQWAMGNFTMLPEALFSGRKQQITRCTIVLSPRIVKSLNKMHFACFNWTRMQRLEPIGLALYKRLFFHLSNRFQNDTNPRELRFKKDYDVICREWLGGLKPAVYKSDIVKQLGRHLSALTRSGLLGGYSIEPLVKRDGWQIVFRPGRGFFADYDRFYVKKWQPQLRFTQLADKRNIQEPLELVAHFHKLLNHPHNTFEDKETAYADELLNRFTYDDVKELVGYAVEKAEETKFSMQQFQALKVYLERWIAERGQREVDREKAKERSRELAIREACPYCEGSGFVHIRNARGVTYAYPCPHDAAKVKAAEERLSQAN